jgi:asparagine synthase (glutamine-hydrolysing)
MCGINGIYDFNGNVVRREQLEVMNSKMVHRGPDDDGYFVSGPFGMGMRRLAIIDIEGGKQPITNEDERFFAVLNGEIYNYVELQKELVARGHILTTKSDTEVLVHLFEDEGTKCVQRLNGMFVFAIWDDLKRELFLFRDRIGIKPLFYTRQNNLFVFSSDLSSLTAILPLAKDVSLDAFLLYLGLSYVPYPWTIFRNVHKLEPGHYLEVDSSNEVIISKYWDIEEFETLRLAKIEDYQSLVLELLRDSIRLQMRSDVPIGTFLSGGVDSSCVVALLAEQTSQPVRTFSVGFEGHHTDERPYARLVAERFQTDHLELMITADDICNYFHKVINFLDEPLADNALFPTLMLSELARERGVKVILNGSGGDEIFGGYGRYRPKR